MLLDDYNDYIMMVDLARRLKNRVVARMKEVENDQTEYAKGYLTAIKEAITDIEDVFWQTKDSSA